MSLSPKDDPRTWLVPGPRAVPRPPLDARLLYYDVSTNECALLRAMCEQCSDGSRCWARLDTYRLTSGLCVKTIGDLIHGRNYIDPRPPGFVGPMNARHSPGLIERRILIELAPAKKPSRRLHQWHTVPAIYSINEAALSLKKEILGRLEDGVQQNIPGIPRPPRPGEPVEIAPEHVPAAVGQNQSYRETKPPEHPALRAGSTRHHVPDHPAPRAEHPAPRADDSKAFDSNAIDTRDIDSTAGEASKTPPALKGLAKQLCLEIAFPATSGNMTAVAAAIEAVRKQYGFTSYQETFDWLKPRADAGMKHQGQLRRSQFDRFFFEDAEYNRTLTEDQRRAIDAEVEEIRARRPAAGAALYELFPSPSSLALPAPEIIGICGTCGGQGQVHQSSSLPGPRLIPCPDCAAGGTYK